MDANYDPGKPDGSDINFLPFGKQCASVTWPILAFIYIKNNNKISEKQAVEKKLSFHVD